MLYRIWGWATVFDPQGRAVDDRLILGQLAGFVDEDDLYATDYIGDVAEEGIQAAALERSGRLRFALREDEETLRVVTEYVARRVLTPAELRRLREYTLGQWEDGMGECLFVLSGPYADYKLQPLGASDVDDAGYPFVEVEDVPGTPT